MNGVVESWNYTHTRTHARTHARTNTQTHIFLGGLETVERIFLNCNILQKSSEKTTADSVRSNPSINANLKDVTILLLTFVYFIATNQLSQKRKKHWRREIRSSVRKSCLSVVTKLIMSYNTSNPNNTSGLKLRPFVELLIILLGYTLMRKYNFHILKDNFPKNQQCYDSYHDESMEQ